MKQETGDKQVQCQMPIYTCSCGAQILVVPDLAEMQRAITAHIADHKRRTGKRISEHVLADKIIGLLSKFFL
jgi:hypothetical protein